MSTFKQIQSEIAPQMEALNRRIRESLHTDNPLMNRVIEQFLESKGKQIRPMIVLLTARMFGDVNDNTLSAAASVEILHSASLIHDDVVDNSKLRRNAPTINAIWDNHIAVLVGDFFVSTAMHQAIATGDIRVIDTLCHMGSQLSLGELDQIYNARFHKLTEDGYFRVISYKTASLFVACAKMGCYTAGVADDRLAAIARFAELLGQCFQIRDDIFDYFDSNKVGKPTGNDLKEGKITLPLLHTLVNGLDAEHDAMLALSQKELLTDDDIARLTQYAIDNGGIDYAYRRMAELRREGEEAIVTLPDNYAHRALLAIFDQIIAREY